MDVIIPFKDLVKFSNEKFFITLSFPAAPKILASSGSRTNFALDIDIQLQTSERSKRIMSFL